MRRTRLEVAITVQSSSTATLLSWICDAVHEAQKQADAERRLRLSNNEFFPGLLICREDKVRVELRKETSSHNTPHIHVTHSDKIDASISIESFKVLAGEIDGTTLKHLKKRLVPVKGKLKEIWDELNEKDNSVAAEKLINSLFS